MSCLSNYGRVLRGLLLAACVLVLNSPTSAQAQSAGSAKPETLEELGETLAPSVEYPPALDRMAVHQALAGGLPHESRGNVGMGPHATPEQVQQALAKVEFPHIEGPFAPTWQSIADHYKLPTWIEEGKFGIFIHFGLYSVPAYHNEWYQKHMYGNGGIRNWHIQKFGPLDKFGYKDFIPMFTLPKFDPQQWAEVFKASGARWVMPTAEHHDGYSLWDSEVNRFNSVKTGPKRDITGELAEAVRAQGLKFGVTNHTIEHYDFIDPSKIPADMKTDLEDEGYEDFYWTTHSDERMVEHLAVWLRKNIELIDKYHPSILWFDNGVNHRVFDPLKLKVLAYYYNRAQEWGEQVTVTGKGTAFIAGDLQDFETTGRMPRRMTDFIWLDHDNLAKTWGYTEGSRAKDAGSVINTLVECVSRNGVFVVNVSPRGDGSIPEDQIAALRRVGQWLEVNGEAIYGSRVWIKSGEDDICFTTGGGNLYAIFMRWPQGGAGLVTSLPVDGPAGKPTAAMLLGGNGAVKFEQTAEGLKLALPAEPPAEGPQVVRIEGLKL